jgi:hypothetical protein
MYQTNTIGAELLHNCSSKRMLRWHYFSYHCEYFSILLKITCILLQITRILLAFICQASFLTGKGARKITKRQVICLTNLHD